jgi:hypothetical protein
MVPPGHMMETSDVTESGWNFIMGECNVFLGDSFGLTGLAFGWIGYDGPFVQGTKYIDKTEMAITTADGDPQWSDFVNIILMGLFAAERANISSDTASRLGETSTVLGSELVNAVSAAGNFEDVAWSDEQAKSLRANQNLQNNGTTGLLCSIGFGDTLKKGPGPNVGGTLESITTRQDKKLRCGVRGDRPGFASFDNSSATGSFPQGLDVDFCTALAAGIFGSNEAAHDSIFFVPITNETQGYVKLQARDVDVLSGFTWNIQDDYHEPTTGVGYTFSQPYFYAPTETSIRNRCVLS